MLDAAVVLGVVVSGLVALGALAVLALVLRWYCRSLTQAQEFQARCLSKARDYQLKAIGDAIASGRQRAALSGGGAAERPDTENLRVRKVLEQVQDAELDALEALD